ncbi:MAG: hypothetical protein IJT65_06650 [Eubacterium sp.]|nr:hypothetical protein [Eubacterium sp.]
MGTFDDIISNAKNGDFDAIVEKTKLYAEKATKKGAEKLEVSKKKIELLDSKTKLSKAYEKYGKLMYAVHCGEEVNENEIDSRLAEIQLQKTRAELLDEELKELKRMFSEPMSKPATEPEKVDVEIVEVENDE